MYTRKKECWTVKADGQKEKFQKHLLLLNIWDVFLELKKVNPDVQIGFSKFCELQPKYVVNVNSSGIHKVCGCEYHQNVKLMLLSLPVKIDYKDVICKAVCNNDTRNCMIYVCEYCPGKQDIHNYLINYFINNENELDDDISYMQWLSTDQTTMNKLTSTIEEYINLLSEKVFELCEHCFISKAQSNFLKYKKETVSQNEAIILLDFAENYSFIIQDAVQGFHWENSQATLHPSVAYYRNTNGNLESQSLCVVSDHQKHNQPAVHSFWQ